MDVIRSEGGNSPGEQKERGDSASNEEKEEEAERKENKEQREDTRDRDRIGARETCMHGRSIRKEGKKKDWHAERRQRLRGIAKDGESLRKDFVAFHVIGRRVRRRRMNAIFHECHRGGRQLPEAESAIGESAKRATGRLRLDAFSRTRKTRPYLVRS